MRTFPLPSPFAALILACMLTLCAALSADALPVGTQVNLSGAWDIKFENGQTGVMTLAWQKTGPESYKGKASLPGCGEVDVASTMVRDGFRIGYWTTFEVVRTDPSKSPCMKITLFVNALTSDNYITGNMQSGLKPFPGNITKINFTAKKR